MCTLMSTNQHMRRMYTTMRHIIVERHMRFLQADTDAIYRFLEASMQNYCKEVFKAIYNNNGFVSSIVPNGQEANTVIRNAFLTNAPEIDYVNSMSVYHRKVHHVIMRCFRDMDVVEQNFRDVVKNTFAVDEQFYLFIMLMSHIDHSYIEDHELYLSILYLIFYHKKELNLGATLSNRFVQTLSLETQSTLYNDVLYLYSRIFMNHDLFLHFFDKKVIPIDTISPRIVYPCFCKQHVISFFNTVIHMRMSFPYNSIIETNYNTLKNCLFNEEVAHRTFYTPPFFLPYSTLVDQEMKQIKRLVPLYIPHPLRRNHDGTYVMIKLWSREFKRLEIDINRNHSRETCEQRYFVETSIYHAILHHWYRVFGN